MSPISRRTLLQRLGLTASVVATPAVTPIQLQASVIGVPVFLCPICGLHLLHRAYPKRPEFTVDLECSPCGQAFRVRLPRVPVTPIPYSEK